MVVVVVVVVSPQAVVAVAGGVELGGRSVTARGDEGAVPRRVHATIETKADRNDKSGKTEVVRNKLAELVGRDG